MIPFILAAVGGYLIGDSMKDSEKYAEGGRFFDEKTLIGKRIKMIHMDDPNPIEPNTMGTIIYVDGMGQYGVKWDNGRSLSVIPEEDKFEIIDKMADGGVMDKAGTRLHMRVEPSTFEEDMEEAKMRMGKYWDVLSDEEKIEATKYLKSKGEIGHMGQEEDVETFMANLNYKKGGKLK